MKRLLPSLRKKKRYVAFEIVSESQHDSKSVKNAIWDAILDLFGEYGGSIINAHIIEEKYEKNKGIIKCSHTSIDWLIASLCIVRNVGGKPATIRSVGVSSTIEKAKSFL